MDLSVLTNTIILAMCYVIGMVAKSTEKVPNKWIPTICVCSGSMIGLALYLVGAADLQADNFVMAIIVGAISGFASTGLNQLFVQANKDDNEKEGESDELV